MKKVKRYHLTATNTFNTKKQMEEQAEELRRYPNYYNVQTEIKEEIVREETDKVHLVERGDSLGLGELVFACHIKPTEGMMAYMGVDDTWHYITCEICRKTKLWKKLHEESD